MYCRNCGKEVHSKHECVHCGDYYLNGNNYCQKCGSETSLYAFKCNICSNQLLEIPETHINIADTIIAFLIPVIGFILYMMYKDDLLIRSKYLRNASKYGIYFYTLLAITIFIFKIIIS